MTALQLLALMPDGERRSPCGSVGKTTFLVAYRGLRAPVHALHYSDDETLVLAPFEKPALLGARRLPPGIWTLDLALQWAAFMAPSLRWPSETKRQRDRLSGIAEKAL